MMTTKELQTQGKFIFVEWITTIAVFISCFAYLSLEPLSLKSERFSQSPSCDGSVLGAMGFLRNPFRSPCGNFENL